MTLETLWVVGEVLGGDKGGWMLQGIFENEEDAILNCQPDEFVGEFELNKRLPNHVKDALTIYFPHKEAKLNREQYREKLSEIFKAVTGNEIKGL